MTTKYHINPATGNPGVCKAKHQCRFGDLETDHYSSKEDARAAFEKQGKDYFNALTKGDLAAQQHSEIEKAKKEFHNSKIPAPEFHGNPEFQLKQKESFRDLISKGDAAETSLGASRFYWYATAMKGSGRAQELAYNKWKDSVAAYEEDWEAGEKFDTSIEGPISLTNKSGLVKTEKPGFYASERDNYIVYRRGAGPSFSLTKSKNYGWMVGSGPGSSKFAVPNKRVGIKAIQVLHDMEVSRAVGRWESSFSLDDARNVVNSLHSRNPGGFAYDFVPSLKNQLDRF
jgi:hypothetical protein